MTNPRVSLLLPIYNVENYIEKCLHSLFRQSYNNIEFIFIDDCGTDNSMLIMKDVMRLYPLRMKDVKIYSHEINRGLAAARNTAIENTSGKYLLHVDSDDYLDTNAISLLVEKAEKENADIVITDTYFVYANKIVLKKEISPKSPQEYMEQVLKRQTFLCVWGKLFRKSLFNDIRFVEGLNFGEDYSVLPCLIYNAVKISKVDTGLYYYIQYNTSSYTRNLSLKSLNQVCAANEHIVTFFLSRDINYERLMLQSKLYLKLHLLKSMYKDKDLLKEVVNRYVEADIISFQLPLFDRIVFYLSKRHLYTLLTVYMNVAMFFKNKLSLV